VRRGEVNVAVHGLGRAKQFKPHPLATMGAGGQMLAFHDQHIMRHPMLIVVHPIDATSGRFLGGSISRYRS
jgi:hypothetical protein